MQSIVRFLDPEDELGVQGAAGSDSVRFVESRPMGAAWLLRGVGSAGDRNRPDEAREGAAIQ